MSTREYPQAGNWKRFQSFAWFGKPTDADKMCLYYTHHRDSPILDQSNAAVIERILGRFTAGNHPSVIPQNHSHCLVGWIEGYAIRVNDRRGKPTKAYIELCNIIDKLNDYPVLDDRDLSEREYNALVDDIEFKLSLYKQRYPDQSHGYMHAGHIMDWLSKNGYDNELEVDEHGNGPSCESVAKAVMAILNGESVLVK